MSDAECYEHLFDMVSELRETQEEWDDGKSIYSEKLKARVQLKIDALRHAMKRLDEITGG